MVCPFILSAIRHEAQTYLSHGLFQDALGVYDHLLDNTGDLHPAIKTTVERAKTRIRSAARKHDLDEAVQISEIEMKRIKEGWSRGATAEELVVSARTLTDLGRYKHAAEEYRRLLVIGHRPRVAIRGVTICLLHLVGSERFANAVALFASDVYKKPKNQMGLKLLMAKYIDAKKYPRQLATLYRQLTHAHPVSGRMRAKISALGDRVNRAAPPSLHDDAYGPLGNLNALCKDIKPKPQS